MRTVTKLKIFTANFSSLVVQDSNSIFFQFFFLLILLSNRLCVRFSFHLTILLSFLFYVPPLIHLFSSRRQIKLTLTIIYDRPKKEISFFVLFFPFSFAPKNLSSRYLALTFQCDCHCSHGTRNFVDDGISLTTIYET